MRGPAGGRSQVDEAGRAGADAQRQQKQCGGFAVKRVAQQQGSSNHAGVAGRRAWASRFL